MVEKETNSERDLRVKVINLQRLLHCMQGDRLKELISQRNPREVINNVQYAQSLLRDIENSMQVTASWQGYDDRSLALLNELVDGVDKMCNAANTLIQSVANEQEPDLIDKIFYSPENEEVIEDLSAMDEEGSDAFNFDANSASNGDETVTSDNFDETSRILESEVNATQKEMQEMLEEEIAEMASRLKESSLIMNQSLKEQNQNMENMMNMATDLETRVTDVTDKVEDRNRKNGWIKTLGSWSLVFMIASSFAGMLVFMKFLPKRNNACIFSCNHESRSQFNDIERSYIPHKIMPDTDRCNANHADECFTQNDNGMKEEYQEDFVNNVDEEYQEYIEATIITEAAEEVQEFQEDFVNNDDEEYQEYFETTMITEAAEEVPLESFTCNNGECHVHEDKSKEGKYEDQNDDPEIVYLEMKRAIFERDQNRLVQLMGLSPEAIHLADKNGWLLQHECVRFGFLEELIILHEHGADLNKRTRFGEGFSAKDLSTQFLVPDHPLVEYLLPY